MSSAQDQSISIELATEVSGVIRLDDKDPWVILKVLEFIYKGTYTYDLDHPWSPDLPQDAESSKMNGRPPASSSGAGSVGSVVTRPINPGKFYLDMRMLGEADYFMLDDLRDELTDRLYESLPEMIRGENLEYYPYRKDCLKDDNFIMIVQEMYSTRCDYENLRESFIHDLVTIDTIVTTQGGQDR
ncbi:hypothetical protein N7454_006097 [Penicillium verhagenii]|nr:hypothetical protein N7454_006097 [Penicillium verhagenii]